MEKQFKVVAEGTQVQIADLNGIGEVEALADDRLLSEFARMTPFDGSTVTKLILPYGHITSANSPTVGPNGASGSVIVRNFRAVIGSRTAVGTDTKKNWRDIRSVVVIGSSVSIAANSSGNPRWDLVYAAITPDADSPTVLRKVKNSTTKAITEQSVVASSETTYVLTVTAGTAAASPVFPSIPADSSGTYYIPLAYIRVPNGFNATSTVAKADICMAAPSMAIAHSTGGVNIQVANQNYLAGGVVLSTANQQSWGSTGTRNVSYMPPTMTGGDTIMAAIKLVTGSVSHTTGAVIDSRDWRGRLCMAMAAVGSTNGYKFPWDPTATSAVPDASGSYISPTSGNTGMVIASGQTFVESAAATSKCYLLQLTTSNSTIAAASSVDIYVDLADSGKLKVQYTGSPDRCIFVQLGFSGPFENG